MYSLELTCKLINVEIVIKKKKKKKDYKASVARIQHNSKGYIKYLPTDSDSWNGPKGSQPL